MPELQPNKSNKNNEESFWNKNIIWFIVGGVVIGILILVIVISKCTDSGRLDSNGDKIQVLLKETKRYHTLASQDKDPLVAFSHANYAWISIRLLKELFSEGEISKIVDYQTLQKWYQETDDLQHHLSKKISFANYGLGKSKY
jgi:hypothetical protein